MQNLSSPIGIIGAGAVAHVLGRCLHAGGEPVIALASRSSSSSKRAAAYIGSSVQVVSVLEIARLTNRVIIAVADEAIRPVVQALAMAEMSGTVLHTSGASGLAPCVPLQDTGVSCGVLHPLQTVVIPDQGTRNFKGVAFGVAGDSQAVKWAKAIVCRLDGDALHLCADGLPSYHAGAVMASNALTAAIDAALALLVQAGLEREVALRAIGPLCRASVDNTLRFGPYGALTGPVVRGDTGTIAAHLAAVEQAPTSVAALYRATARHLLSLARERNLSSASLRSLVQMLEDYEVKNHNDCEKGSNH